MPANIETGVYSNVPAWHKEGTVLDSQGEKGLTVAQALQGSGLDWYVEKVPVYAATKYDQHGEPDLKHPFTRVEGRWGVQRDLDHRVLGVVGSTWEPVQNSAGFALIEDVMQGGDVWIEAAGALDGGRKVWVLAHVAEDLQIAGEDVAQYILFTNGHDGRTSVTAAMTNVRVVCENTFDLALATAQRLVRVRHTTKATERLAAAKEILGLRNLYAEELAAMGEWLVKDEMSDKAFDRFLQQLMPVREDQEDKPAATMIRNRREEVRSVWTEADNLESIRKTKWGALNAVIEWSDYGRAFRDSETQLKAQWGLNSVTGSVKDRALELLSA